LKYGGIFSVDCIVINSEAKFGLGLESCIDKFLASPSNSCNIIK